MRFIDDLNLFNDFGETLPLTLANEELETLYGYAEEIHKINFSNHSLKYEAIGALLKLLLIHYHNLCSLKPIDISLQESGNSVIRKLKAVIN